MVTSPLRVFAPWSQHRADTDAALGDRQIGAADFASLRFFFHRQNEPRLRLTCPLPTQTARYSLTFECCSPLLGNPILRRWQPAYL
jgi:hypothetical protein